MIIDGMIIRIYLFLERIEFKKRYEIIKEKLMINLFLIGNVVKY